MESTNQVDVSNIRLEERERILAEKERLLEERNAELDKRTQSLVQREKDLVQIENDLIQRRNHINMDEVNIESQWDDIILAGEKLAQTEAGLRSHALDQREEKINRKKQQLRQLRSKLREKETEMIRTHSGYLPSYTWSSNDVYPFSRVMDQCYSSSEED
jgi:uncharacterized protein (DUF3084 family)